MKKTFTINLEPGQFVRPTNLKETEDFLPVGSITILPDFMYIIEVIGIDGRIFTVNSHAWEEWYLDD